LAALGGNQTAASRLPSTSDKPQAIPLAEAEGQPSSGAWLFAIAAKGGNLFPQSLNSNGISAGDGYGKSKFQLFQLMVALATARRRGRSGVSRRRAAQT